MKNFDIDLVYLWCDGRDSKFAQQKHARMQQCGAQVKGNEDCRYVQVNELKYSLRSVAMYMPWIHHIYIVTNNQVPKWFRPHEKITIVDHSEILPESARPCFNSQALECCLHKIPNLAEHFIYANDDCFVGRKLSPSFFYDRMARPIVRVINAIPADGVHSRTIQNAYDAIAQRFGVSYEKYVTHHNMDAYTKSILLECEKEFPELLNHTIHQPFRHESGVQRILFHLYALAKNQAVLKDVNRTFFQRVLKKFYLAYVDSYTLSSCIPLRHIAPNHPALFCINDCEISTDENRTQVLNFLKKKFPHKSAYEQDV